MVLWRKIFPASIAHNSNARISCAHFPKLDSGGECVVGAQCTKFCTHMSRTQHRETKTNHQTPHSMNVFSKRSKEQKTAAAITKKNNAESKENETAIA